MNNTSITFSSTSPDMLTSRISVFSHNVPPTGYRFNSVRQVRDAWNVISNLANFNWIIFGTDFTCSYGTL